MELLLPGLHLDVLVVRVVAEAQQVLHMVLEVLVILPQQLLHKVFLADKDIQMLQLIL